jgi:hypothetical protein
LRFLVETELVELRLVLGGALDLECTRQSLFQLLRAETDERLLHDPLGTE